MKVWGWLEMGTAENPIPWGSKAEVVIHGSASDHTMVVAESPTSFAGGAVLVGAEEGLWQELNTSCGA